MRWVWIDRFLEFTPQRTATAVKTLSHAEDLFTEHFPGFPVMPASLLLEGLAQTGGILVGEANNFREKVVLAKIPFAKIHREVLAGETLTYITTLSELRTEGAIVAGQVRCGDDLVLEAEIFFAHLDRNRSQQVFGEHNFVFTGELEHLLGQARLAAGQTPRELPPAGG
jgi:3-hydroxyacyl-[acyl-carrier-protein] dehydratase